MRPRGPAACISVAALVLACGPPEPRSGAAREQLEAVAGQQRHTCNICGTTEVFEPVAGRPTAQCPACKSRERHRLLLHYLEHELKVFEQKLDVLHFSPQTAEETALRHQPNWRYMTSNYTAGEDMRIDLTNIKLSDNTWDLIIVYHILEHIVDDRQAMREMHRILRPGGRAFVQVPLELGLQATHEDPTITDPDLRNRYFGQPDHVRKYAPHDLRGRLEAAGFVVEAVDHAGTLDPRLVEKHRLRGEFDPPEDQSIWVCTKPGAPQPEPPAPAQPTRPGTMPQ